MKSWMTTLAGILSILGALYNCYSGGKFDVMCAIAVIQGAGLIAAKDFNVTGGTKAQDDKAGGPAATGTAPIGSIPKQ